MKRLIEYLKQHSVTAEDRNGELWVESVSSDKNGVYVEWVKIEPTYKAVREFLGY